MNCLLTTDEAHVLGFSERNKRKRKDQFNPKMMDVVGLRARGAELRGLGARGCPTNMIWGEMIRPLYANTPTLPPLPHLTLTHPPPNSLCPTRARGPSNWQQ